jgi:MFS family permease
MAEITAVAGEDALLDENPPPEAISPVSAAYRRYALWLLLAIYVVNFIDRQVINILAEPIKNDLHLADWQLGLLSGFAFGIVYTILGFPLARAADRHHRGFIIAACLAGWSAFTGACGFAQNFVQLVAARSGVGIGEAGCTPTSHALIADYTPKEKRASALSFYAMGTPLGGLLGLAIGGVMSDYFGWRQAFMVAAAPGLLLAVIAAFTLKEPRRLLSEAALKARAAGEASGQQLATFSETFRYLLTKRAFWGMASGAGVRAFLGYGHAAFSPSFFYRCHGPAVTALAHHFGLRPQTFVGLALGIIGGGAGAVGSWLGGQIADRLGARDLKVYGTVPTVAVLVALPCSVILYTTSSVPLAFAMFGATYLLGALWYGPVYSSAQGMVPQRMRAMSASIMLFVINFLGLVLGALSLGALSDLLNKGLHLGPAEGVRWALLSSAVVGALGAGLFWGARRRIAEEMVS